MPHKADEVILPKYALSCGATVRKTTVSSGKSSQKQNSQSCDAAAFFANGKDYTEISIYPGTPAAFEIEPSGGIRQCFSAAVGIGQDVFRLFPDPFFKR